MNEQVKVERALLEARGGERSDSTLLFPAWSEEPSGLLGSNLITSVGYNDSRGPILRFKAAFSASAPPWSISDRSSSGRHPAGWVSRPLCGHRTQWSWAAWPKWPLWPRAH